MWLRRAYLTSSALLLAPDLQGDGYGRRPGFSKINYTVNVDSKELQQRVRELIGAVERRCPAHNTVMHGTRGEFVYVLNGQPLEV
jgi:OsmC-like protein